MDINAAYRSIPLRQVMAALGIDLSQFKKRSGKAEWFGKCCFHDAKTNQTSLSFTDDLYHCFGCQAKGKGAIDFVRDYQKTGFQPAVDWLKGLRSQPMPKEAPEPVSEATDGNLQLVPKRFTYHKYFKPNEWLSNRCPDPAVLDRYGVGFYSNPQRKSHYEGKVFIPIKDVAGQLYGYLVRTLEPKDGESKYYWPKGLPKTPFLFGAHELAQHQQSLPQAGTGNGDRRVKVVYLLESPFCVLKFASMGLQAVASYGWSVSQEQIEHLAKIARGVVFLPDSNKYQQAGESLVRLASRLWVRFPPLPDGVDDPEQLSREQILAL